MSSTRLRGESFRVALVHVRHRLVVEQVAENQRRIDAVHRASLAPKTLAVQEKSTQSPGPGEVLPLAG